ncbi:MAG: bacteriohemerythrin [Proteobacteria bacterium]|nr:bacteriohemerythrin [Pseudomonadota bacterium]MBU1687370.1 bacteriohemerythrin [Pseudomonadota bacterium]
MPFIEWNNDFSVNNVEIDNQHKHWICIINSLHQVLMIEGNGNIKEKVTGALVEMNTYTRRHFAYEEMCMRRVDYPGTIEHIKLHNAFAAQITRYLSKIYSGELVMGTEVMARLNSWLRDHILIEDQKYCSYLAENKDKLTGLSFD